MCANRPLLIVPSNVQSVDVRLRPYTSDELSFSSVEPPTTTQAKFDVGGSATHDAFHIPVGKSGPFTHFEVFTFRTSVFFGVMFLIRPSTNYDDGLC